MSRSCSFGVGPLRGVPAFARYARESWPKNSFLSAHVDGVIRGLGLRGYELALRHLLSLSQHPHE